MRLMRSACWVICLGVVLGLDGCSSPGVNAGTQVQVKPANAVAQYRLAHRYFKGEGVAKDPVKGMIWLLRSAEQAYAPAQAEVGRRYLKMHGEQQLAAKWLRKAADQGNMEGEFVLGLLYFDGNGVPKDIKRAVTLLRRAAKQGLLRPQYMLIFLYADGIATRPDARKAAYWLKGKPVTDAGKADNLLGNFFNHGFKVEVDGLETLSWVYTHEGVPAAKLEPYLARINHHHWRDENRAVHWYLAGAKAGSRDAQVSLAAIYQNRNSLYWNCGKALHWALAAAGRGDAEAMAMLGNMYEQGPAVSEVRIGTQVKPVKQGIKIVSVKNGEAAQRAGLRPGDVVTSVNAVAVQQLGVAGLVARIRASKNKTLSLRVRRAGQQQVKTVFVVPRQMNGECPGAKKAGLRRDIAQAIGWYKRAAAKGDINSMLRMAHAYEQGKYVARNYKKAVSLYTRAAKAGSWMAAADLSKIYADGIETKKNKALSKKWSGEILKLMQTSMEKN